MAETAEIYHLPTKPRRQPSVNSWRWNELEDEALMALPPEIERLYLHGLRKHMDYATGITGQKRRVSMEMFAEILEYHPPAGSREKARLYSRQQITRMLDKLEDAGLIERLHRGKGVKAAMEFRLPLACCDYEEGESQPNPHSRASGGGSTEQGASHAQQRARSEQGGASQEKPHSRASGEGNSEQGASREERATSGSPVNQFSTDVENVDAQAAKPKRRQWGEEIDYELVTEMVAAVSADLDAPVKHNPTTWANEFRLMRERDGRTVEQIRYLITWTAKHEFWSGIVLSPKKLREKWDQLAKQVKQQHQPSRQTPGRHTGLHAPDTSNLVAKGDGTYEF